MHAQSVGIVLGRTVQSPVTAQFTQQPSADPRGIQPRMMAQDVVRQFMRDDHRELRISQLVQKRTRYLYQPPVGNRIHGGADA